MERRTLNAHGGSSRLSVFRNVSQRSLCKGANACGEFWGCSKFPTCKGFGKRVNLKT